jgi:hypothetical protein
MILLPCGHTTRRKSAAFSRWNEHEGENLLVFKTPSEEKDHQHDRSQVPSRILSPRRHQEQPEVSSMILLPPCGHTRRKPAAFSRWNEHEVSRPDEAEEA